MRIILHKTMSADGTHYCVVLVTAAVTTTPAASRQLTVIRHRCFCSEPDGIPVCIRFPNRRFNFIMQADRAARTTRLCTNRSLLRSPCFLCRSPSLSPLSNHTTRSSAERRYICVTYALVAQGVSVASCLARVASFLWLFRFRRTFFFAKKVKVQSTPSSLVQNATEKLQLLVVLPDCVIP